MVAGGGALPSFTVVLLDRPSEVPKEIDVTPVAVLAEPEVAGQETGEKNGVRK